MRTLIKITALWLVFCGLSACRTQKVTEYVPTEKIRTEVKIERFTETDTIFVPIPLQTAERTTADSTSFLENDYAKSHAAILPDGSLFHDLLTKPQNVPTPVDKQVERRDSTAYIDRTIKVPVEVERKLTFWERCKLSTWSYILSALVLALLALFRKPLGRVVRRVLRLPSGE